MSASSVCNSAGSVPLSWQTSNVIMEDWSKDFFTTLELVADEVEQFFAEVAQEVNETIEAFAKLSEAMVEHVQTTFTTEFDQQVDELTGSLLELYFGLENPSEDGFAEPLIYNVEPMQQSRYPACTGCRHYHGQIYGGNLLICGMHPYGVEGPSCTDWEAR